MSSSSTSTIPASTSTNVEDIKKIADRKEYEKPRAPSSVPTRPFTDGQQGALKNLGLTDDQIAQFKVTDEHGRYVITSSPVSLEEGALRGIVMDHDGRVLHSGTVYPQSVSCVGLEAVGGEYAAKIQDTQNILLPGIVILRPHLPGLVLTILYDREHGCTLVCTSSKIIYYSEGHEVYSKKSKFDTTSSSPHTFLDMLAESGFKIADVASNCGDENMSLLLHVCSPEISNGSFVAKKAACVISCDNENYLAYLKSLNGLPEMSLYKDETGIFKYPVFDQEKADSFLRMGVYPELTGYLQSGSDTLMTGEGLVVEFPASDGGNLVKLMHPSFIQRRKVAFETSNMKKNLLEFIARQIYKDEWRKLPFPPLSSAELNSGDLRETIHTYLTSGEKIDNRSLTFTNYGQQINCAVETAVTAFYFSLTQQQAAKLTLAPRDTFFGIIDNLLKILFDSQKELFSRKMEINKENLTHAFLTRAPSTPNMEEKRNQTAVSIGVDIIMGSRQGAVRKSKEVPKNGKPFNFPQALANGIRSSLNTHNNIYTLARFFGLW